MRVVVIGLGLALTLTACGSSSPTASEISHTAVTLRIPASSLVATSPAVWKNGRAWFAVAVDNELRMYRWEHSDWALEGVAPLPFGNVQNSGDITTANLTGGATPDFVVHAYGADTLWLAYVAYLAGRWQFVPFDDQFRRRDQFTFGAGVKAQRIEGVFDPCGCASGPTTVQWYRLAARVFVATTPPGAHAECSRGALASAHSWPALPYDPLLRNVARQLKLIHFACADGWALATDGRSIGVYEQHGPNLNDSSGHYWLRVGVGTPKIFGQETDFALPQSVLQMLARKIGVKLAQASPFSGKPQPGPPQSLRERAPITVQVKPGDAYWTTDLSAKHVNRLTVTTRSRTGVITRTRFSWRSGAWVKLPSGS